MNNCINLTLLNKVTYDGLEKRQYQYCFKIVVQYEQKDQLGLKLEFVSHAHEIQEFQLLDNPKASEEGDHN